MRLTQWNIFLILCTLVINQSLAAMPQQCQNKNHSPSTAQATMNHAGMNHSHIGHELMADASHQTTSDLNMTCCDDCQCDVNTCQNSIYDINNNSMLVFDGHHTNWINQPTWLLKKHNETLLKPPTIS